jgi:hypothetical protein
VIGRTPLESFLLGERRVDRVLYPPKGCPQIASPIARDWVANRGIVLNDRTEKPICLFGTKQFASGAPQRISASITERLPCHALSRH